MTLRFEPRQGISQVILVGCGGTGSQLARSLARICFDLRRRGMAIPALTFIDPDHFEPGNIGRQLATESDLGQNKAAVLARRFNLALGLDIAAIPAPFDPERHLRGPHTLLIGCVDNHLARRALATANCLAIDTGNARESGQVICGSTSDPAVLRRALDRVHKGVIDALPGAALIFPALLDPDPEPTPAASCAARVDAGSQHLLINDMVAAVAASYVYRLLHRQPLTHHLTYLSLDAVRPVEITRESLAACL